MLFDGFFGEENEEKKEEDNNDNNKVYAICPICSNYILIILSTNLYSKYIMETLCPHCGHINYTKFDD